MRNINIAISCVGSGIGQSIIDSCKLSSLPLTTYGLDSNSLAYGLYDCDHIIKTPKVKSKNYIEKIIDICLNHNIQIIIPGLDDELKLFSQNLKKFNLAGIEVIISDEPLLNLVRDKALTTKTLRSLADVFVKSFHSTEEFLKALDKKEISYPVIAKPSGGSASAGVHILFDDSDLEVLTENHIIQEIAKPHKNDINFNIYEKFISKKINPQISEISIQLVSNKNGDIIGKMASFNRLKSGVPVEIIPYKNTDIWNEINKIIPKLITLGYRGPLNIQGRLTDNGLKIFEINARFTGITGLRALMGFNEVEACIKSWLNLEEKDNLLQLNYDSFGIRQILNKVVHKDRNPSVESLFSQINKPVSTSTKKLIITGATGFLGRNLINALDNQNSNYTIVALVRDTKKAQLILPKSVQIYDADDLEKGVISFGSFDVLLHLGFARPHKSHEEIAESLTFTGKIFRRASENHLSNIINVSSQSVYGHSCLPPWNEKTIVAPYNPYYTSKYCTELLLNELSHKNKHTNTTSLRLASTVGGADGLINVDLLSRFVKKVKNGENIKVIGSLQKTEKLDIRDAVLAIIALLETPSKKWKSVYNIGPSNPITLQELAEEVIKIGKIYNANNTSKIDYEEKENQLKFGMDITSFISDTGWKPKHSIQDTMHSLFNYDY